MAKKESSDKGLGITADKDDFSEWFTQLMIKAELADYTDVSGCLVIRPYAFSIWEKVVVETDKRLKALGVQNAYFPIFIPEKLFNKEKEHVQGFSPEVAWVTEAGDSKLSERLAIRPTSETIMYPSFAKWIRSHRDLPLKINQWNNAVRWEFKHPVPFFRTREFLWNELHTVNSSENEAIEEGEGIIEAYRDVCENQMAIYGKYGLKTDSEKFAGAVFSKKIHYIMPNGKVAEGPCFHYDGQNFSKAYDIEFLDKDGKKKYAHQCTYAISTRMLGVMFAIHSDDKGLILPPRIAPTQVVIIPIFQEGNKKEVISAAKSLALSLSSVRVIVDEREGYTPGWKFNDFEMKGIPLRIEIGPKDLEKKSVVVANRSTGEKIIVKISDVKKTIPQMLEKIHESMLDKSKKIFASHVQRAITLAELKKVIADKKTAISPMCKNEKCESSIKSETGGAKALLIDDESKTRQGDKCLICGKKAEYNLYIGKTY